MSQDTKGIVLDPSNACSSIYIGFLADLHCRQQRSPHRTRRRSKKSVQNSVGGQQRTRQRLQVLVLDAGGLRQGRIAQLRQSGADRRRGRVALQVDRHHRQRRRSRRGKSSICRNGGRGNVTSIRRSGDNIDGDVQSDRHRFLPGATRAKGDPNRKLAHHSHRLQCLK
jgi:hypothetical protein